MRKTGSFACVLMLLAATAHAHHIQGKIWCDANASGSIDGPDTPLNGVVVRVVSQTVSPGQLFVDTSGDSVPSGNPGPGAYRVNLPGRTDDYLVELSAASLPGGATVILPPGGSYLLHIVTGNPTLDHVDGVDFLLNNCLPPTTSTTSTTTSTSTTSTPSTSSSTSTSSTSTSSPIPSTTSTTTSTTSTSAPPSTSSTTSSTTSTTATTTPLTVCEDVLDHFKCYKLRAGAQLTRPELEVTDQFETKNTQVQRPIRFCNPVDKNGEGINDATAHLMCYQAKDVRGQARFQRTRVRVENQFGTQDLNVYKTDVLCLPATKNEVPSPLAVDRMKCYRVVQDAAHVFEERDVTLGDQFETRTHTVMKPFLLCNPADVEGQGQLNPSCHLVCYKISNGDGPRFVPEDVTIEDEINSGTVSALSAVCSKAALLCVPSLKTVIQQ